MYIVLLCIAIFKNTTPVLQQDLVHINLLYMLTALKTVPK